MDSPKFDNWLHMISGPVIMRIYTRESEDEMRNFKNEIVEMLRAAYGFTFTPSRDYHLLSRNQVNVPISTLSKIMYDLGVRNCTLSLFGIKCDLVSVEPMIDHYIIRY